MRIFFQLRNTAHRNAHKVFQKTAFAHPLWTLDAAPTVLNQQGVNTWFFLCTHLVQFVASCNKNKDSSPRIVDVVTFEQFVRTAVMRQIKPPHTPNYSLGRLSDEPCGASLPILASQNPGLIIPQLDLYVLQCRGPRNRPFWEWFQW